MEMSMLELCKPIFPEYSIPYIFLDCNIFLTKYVNFLTQGESPPHKRFCIVLHPGSGGCASGFVIPCSLLSERLRNWLFLPFIGNYLWQSFRAFAT